MLTALFVAAATAGIAGWKSNVFLEVSEVRFAPADHVLRKMEVRCPYGYFVVEWTRSADTRIHAKAMSACRLFGSVTGRSDAYPIAGNARVPKELATVIHENAAVQLYLLITKDPAAYSRLESN